MLRWHVAATVGGSSAVQPSYDAGSADCLIGIGSGGLWKGAIEESAVIGVACRCATVMEVMIHAVWDALLQGRLERCGRNCSAQQLRKQLPAPRPPLRHGCQLIAANGMRSCLRETRTAPLRQTGQRPRDSLSGYDR